MHRHEACTLQSVMRLQLRAHARSFVRVWVNWQPKSLRGNVLWAQQTVTQTQGNTNYSRLPAKSTILQLSACARSGVAAISALRINCPEADSPPRVPGAQIEIYWHIFLSEMKRFRQNLRHCWLNAFAAIHCDLMRFASVLSLVALQQLSRQETHLQIEASPNKHRFMFRPGANVFWITQTAWPKPTFYYSINKIMNKSPVPPAYVTSSPSITQRYWAQ